MLDITTKTRKWGNSVGVLIGNKIEPGKTVRVLITEKNISKAMDIFGTLKFKTSTDKLMKEMDKELWD